LPVGRPRIDAISAQIRILALIHIAISGLVLLGGLMLVLGLAWSRDDGSRAALEFVGPMYLLVGGFGALPQLIGGLGLYARRPWARWLILAISVPYLFALPLGTALGAFGLWALLSPGGRFGVSADSTNAAPIAGPPILRRDQVNLLLVIAGTGAVIALALGIGFAIDHHTTPSAGPVLGPNGMPVPITPASTAMGTPLSWILQSPLFGIAAVAFSAFLVVPAIARLFRGRRTRDRVLAAHNKRWAGRIAELKADPVRKAYAARIAKGEYWSDAKIDYDMDIDAVVTCTHLQPLERAIRRAGIAVRLNSDVSVVAKCRVDAAALERRGLLADPAYYAEYFQTERSREDNPTAALCCHACKAPKIYVLHSIEGGPDAITFGG
jgi:hypothetical protein